MTVRTQMLEVEVDPGRGAEIVSVRRPGQPNVLAAYGWSTPLRASHSRSYGDERLDWLSEYRGGWQELFPNAGAAATVDGIPLPFHGEASVAAWEILETRPSEIVLRTPVRLPLVLERRMRVRRDRSVLQIDETVVNESQRATPFLWGHHPAFLATEGARIDLPSVSMVADAAFVTATGDLAPGASGSWPTLLGRTGNPVALDSVPRGPVERLAYLSGFGAFGWVAIRGIAPGLGVAMAWDTNAFPCAWFWQEIGGPGHPWHGRARISAIEPNAAFPSDGLSAAIARDDAHVLASGASMEAWLTMAVFDADDRPVAGVNRAGVVRFG